MQRDKIGEVILNLQALRDERLASLPHDWGKLWEVLTVMQEQVNLCRFLLETAKQS